MSVPVSGKYNDLATAFMAFPDKTISHLFSLGSLTPQVSTCPYQNKLTVVAIESCCKHT